MAIRDIRASLTDINTPFEGREDATQEQINRIFSELAHEMGLNDFESFAFGEHEELRLVYDKFLSRNR